LFNPAIAGGFLTVIVRNPKTVADLLGEAA